MIDDLAGISKCGCDSIELNSYINTKIKSKKLTCGADKCKTMHISKKKNDTKANCNELRSIGSQYENKMKNVDHDKYLGDHISNDVSNDINIEERSKNGNWDCITSNFNIKRSNFRISLL